MIDVTLDCKLIVFKLNNLPESLKLCKHGNEPLLVVEVLLISRDVNAIVNNVSELLEQSENRFWLHFLRHIPQKYSPIFRFIGLCRSDAIVEHIELTIIEGLFHWIMYQRFSQVLRRPVITELLNDFIFPHQSPAFFPAFTYIFVAKVRNVFLIL